MQRKFLNQTVSTVLFYIGWIVCLAEVSAANSYYGLLMVLGIVIHYLYSSNCRKADYFLLALVISIGPLSDIFYARVGLFHYHSAFNLSSSTPPLWVFLLWGLFAANIHLFSWLNHRWLLAILLGAIGGPMSYLSVIRLGGISLLKPLPLTILTIGGIWAIVFPCLLWLNLFLKKRFRSVS